MERARTFSRDLGSKVGGKKESRALREELLARDEVLRILRAATHPVHEGSVIVSTGA